MTALACPLWLLVAAWFGGAYQDYYWDSRCYQGEPSFAFGQAALALAGTLAALWASVGTVRAFRGTTRPSASLSLRFCAAAVFLVAWCVVVANAPSTMLCERASLLARAITVG